MPDNSRTEFFETSDGCSISFEIVPTQNLGAPRLALIHPLALDATIWATVAKQLAGQVEVLIFDCPGHGRSGRERVPFTLDMFARTLAELLDHVDWPIAAVAGCSMGGCVAQAFAGLYPTRLSALGLIDTTAWYGSEANEKWRERAAVAREHGFASMTDWQSSRWFSDDFRRRYPTVVNAITGIFLHNDIECYAASCLMLGTMDLRSFQPAIDVPVAIVVGEEDYAAPVAMSQQMHGAISGSTLRILPGVRHLAPVEAPEAITSELLALLDRSRP
jgi:3-oxoadipate enol-lactonase